jgi:glycine/D-amino acid oxidase-like deaminating enzyme
MDLRSGKSLWIKFGRDPLIRPPLDKSIRCQVLIVGSGITGALLASHLAEQALDVVVVDRRDIALGSTPASTALLQYDLDTPLVKLRKKIGRPQADAAYRRSRKAVSDLAELVQRLDLDCDLAQRPSLFLARNEKALPLLRAENRARLEVGMEVEFLDGQSLRRQFGIRRPGAILSRISYEVDPWSLTNQLLHAAEYLGARVFARTALLPVAGGHRSLRTASGRVVVADHVVWATGYEAPQQFTRLKHLCQLHSTFVVATQPVPASRLWPRQALMWETGSPYLYARATPHGRIVIGGKDEPFQNPARRDALIPKKTQQLIRAFQRLYPIGPLNVETAWAGTFAQTDDGLPFIGRTPDYPGCHFALGYGGNGITFSLVAAQIIRDAILGRPDPEVEIFSFNRDSKSPRTRAGSSKMLIRS